MGFFMCFLFAFLLTNRANGATHWIVTEDGRIQSQMDSVFNLQRPYDLVAMLKQEDRARIVEDLRQELLIKKEHIDKSEDRDTGLEQRFYRTDPDCIAAGKCLPDLYISTVLPLENKGIRPEEHIDFKARPTPDPLPPVCTEITRLHFSMDAFEHLEGVRERANLTGSPELGLKNAITHKENVDDYGHLVYEALRKNKTSWVLYNMAAFYWRIKGHPYNVVECLRRALHYSPRNYKDVALISLANVLHRARYSSEAAIVAQAALDISKELNVNHFTLGNIYAVLAEYNKSVICYENTLKIQPDFEAAEKRKHAVLCQAKLEAALEDQHRSLQRTLNDLKEYQEKHEVWQALQEKIQQAQASSDTKFAQRVGYEAYKIRKMTSKVGDHCKVEEREGQHLLRCTWEPSGLPKHEEPDGRTQIQDNIETVAETPPAPAQHSSIPVDLVYLEPVHLPKYRVRRTLTGQEESNAEYKNDDWPSKDECDRYVTKFPAWNEFPTTYLPPENKGFEVKLLLSEAQGLSEGMQHSLPWYPPVCNIIAIPEGSQKTYDHMPSVLDRSKYVQKTPDSAMKPILLALVDGDVTEAEVGQRILTAIKKELGPPWLLYNLAALYWRVIGNSQHGIECLRHSLFLVPTNYRDVPLVNLANLLYKLGQLDDAVAIMKDAVTTNDLEPEVHYFMANVLAAKGNLTGATHHYNQALLQEPDHQPAYDSIRKLKCYYKYHQTAQSAAPPQMTSTPNQPTQSCPQSCPNSCRSPGASCQGNGDEPVNGRLICKNENGRENCVVEMKSASCEQGQCTQTCSVSPLAMETCEGPSGLKCIGHNSNIQDLLFDGGSTRKCPNDLKSSSCLQPSSLEPLSHTIGPNPMADPSFYDKMEAVKEYYQAKGLCTGDDCQKYLVQTSQQRPHTKLELQDGILHQKLILVDSPEDIIVGPNDCIIYNDGRKTAGCQREEYRSFDFDELFTFLSCDEDTCSHGNRHDQQHERESNIKPSKKPSDNNNRNSHSNRPEGQEAEDGEFIIEEDQESELVHFEWGNEERSDSEDGSTTVTSREGRFDNKQQERKYMNEKVAAMKPDLLRHITKVTDIPWPTWDECRRDFRDESDFKKVTFSQFSSTWVSVSAKNMNVQHLINFQVKVEDFKEPFCKKLTGKQAKSDLDKIPSLKDLSALPYSAEQGLTNMLQILGGHTESVEAIGTKIAVALNAKPNSWALANLAALYWRVVGNVEQAVNCLRLGHQLAPDDAKDIALLGVANILYKSAEIEDALAVCDMALQADNEMVATHFTVANIYASKGDWVRARKFYESTLGLQTSFHPARERLHYLRCYKVLSNPNLYKVSASKKHRTEL